MFDIGFSEIVVCAIVALIVIGPERLPETVRTIGLWIGRLKRSLRDTRQEIERQIGVDDIRRQLHNEDIMRSLENARKDINSVIEHSQNSIHSVQHETPKVYTSEPDLPFHAHMDEDLQKEKGAQKELPTISTQAINSQTIDALPETKTPEPASTSVETATTKSTS